jgi:hypothetical protein
MRAMRPTSVVRVVTSIDTRTSSCWTIRSISRRCRTMPSLASVNIGLRKGIVDATLRVEPYGE